LALVFALAAVLGGNGQSWIKAAALQGTVAEAGLPAPVRFIDAHRGGDAASRPQALGLSKRFPPSLSAGNDHDTITLDGLQAGWCGLPVPAAIGTGAPCQAGHPGDGFLIARLPTGPPA
jgi:hypothetical protein